MLNTNIIIIIATIFIQKNNKKLRKTNKHKYIYRFNIVHKII